MRNIQEYVEYTNKDQINESALPSTKEQVQKTLETFKNNFKMVFGEGSARLEALRIYGSEFGWKFIANFCDHEAWFSAWGPIESIDGKKHSVNNYLEIQVIKKEDKRYVLATPEILKIFGKYFTKLGSYDDNTVNIFAASWNSNWVEFVKDLSVYCKSAKKQ